MISPDTESWTNFLLNVSNMLISVEIDEWKLCHSPKWVKSFSQLARAREHYEVFIEKASWDELTTASKLQFGCESRASSLMSNSTKFDLLLVKLLNKAIFRKIRIFKVLEMKVRSSSRVPTWSMFWGVCQVSWSKLWISNFQIIDSNLNL